MGAWCCNQSGICSKAATLVQVILKTLLGDIDIELWPKEAPKVRFIKKLCCVPNTNLQVPNTFKILLNPL